ncbi:cytochrome c family protein [Geomonas sp. Red32]|uniref:cytochrome c3 family protein n=1 Tax=Geomonas sp. Red32 TaxID=2912856 RepID=UPI00202CC61D|nr:cytochrome c3 family protein [Geomonas sp. Red32]MCM0080898.1 cytochrome c family protein [Geomonas sp. Red32]
MKRDRAEDRQARKRSRPLWADLAAVAIAVLAVVAALVDLGTLYPAGLGAHQPIPFSHRVHVTYKRLSCLMCHTGVTTSSRAGIPPLQTCLLCHSRIIVEHPFIRKLRYHYDHNIPVVWERVNWLPEFVYFNHSMHIQRGFDCSWCHGEVSRMDRVVKAKKFQMGFCIQCHRDHHVTHDCFACHR